MANNHPESKNYSHFSHRSCEYYPCHAGADPDNFNCLFCFCPLYALGDKCGGSFVYLENGFKDCSGCLFPHSVHNYAAIMARYPDILALAKQEKSEQASIFSPL